ncbi:sensor histidine kinase [Actomonas aquatica]|uniref:Signal transduction histidine-protein kinase/phosphatase MprB n=1 Tax=Actomonas aquatica TaxID=2866162 RepID=A0ABZ1CEA7_9BACT|nr:HAMP domain-containing sensor histidine kinase [Opitutus sp. WL0086]WRQ90026.1 HAMP domain-containing sensor histidine kinase [Opitutus sp. WL0086]
MKLRLSLAAKIGLWLGLNILLLLVVAGSLLVLSGGLHGWVERAVGDRFRGVADVLMAELNGEDEAGRERLLAGYAADYGLTFVVMLNNGTRVAGPEVVVPDEVAKHLRPPAGGEGAGRVGERLPPPILPPDDMARPQSQAPRPQPPPPQRPRPAEQGRDGRILVEVDEPAGWWMGARVPVSVRQGMPPRPGTLFAISDSVWAFGALFDLRPLVVAVGAALVISALFWLPLVMGITRDLRALERATGRIAEGKFDTRVPATRGDEIGRLGDSVNVMAARLQALVDGQKKFLADVAHELGSPIARLQLGTTILEERVPEGLRAQVEDVREEVEQMGALVAELLDFTQAELGGEAVALEAVTLASVVQEVIAREAGGAKVTVTVPEGLDVCAHERLLNRALGNLVRNAVRHGGAAVTIELKAERSREGGVTLWVRDDGPGVPEAALARLSEPFFRPDAARQRETGGTGLGLSIVRTAVEAMGGRMTLRNRSGGGFEVELWLSDQAPGFTEA